MPDFNAMTIEELDAYSVGLKAQIEALRDERRAAKEVRDEKNIRAHLEQKLSRPDKPVSVEGIDFATVKVLYGISKQTPPGENDVVVTPEAANLDSLLGEPGVETTEDQQ